MSDNDFLKTLKNIIVGSDEKSMISLRAIFESGIGTADVKNLFLVHDVSFYSQDPNVLSLFQGYSFESTCTFHMSIIQLFLDHILNIICDHDLDLYSYIIDGISYLIQKPVNKSETSLIIIGGQSTGKNKFFLDIISQLFGRYVISNENSIGNIIDRFNSSIEDKILIVRIELESIDNAKHLNTYCLKSFITDRFCTIDSKLVNIRSINTVSNFIFVSNNHLPIKIENGDRIHLILKGSDDSKTNFSYLLT